MANPNGRPSSFKTEYATQAKQLCELGATDEELAEFFKVSTRNIYRWQNQFPEFSQALKVGKASADDRVERSLFHRACGFKHEAVKIFMPAGAKEPVHAKYTEIVPPDTTACIFWLKNRRPDLWRDKRDIVVTDTGAADSLSDDELERVVAERSSRRTAAPQGDPSKLN